MFRFKLAAARVVAAAAVLGFGGAVSAQSDGTPVAPPDPLALPRGAGSGAAPVPAVSPATPPPTKQAGECGECAGESAFDWKKVPRVRPFPRIGNSSVPPSG